MSDIQLEHDDIVRFKPMTKNWGAAEFDICLVYRYHKIRKVHIYRRQQEKKEHFVIDVNYGALDFSLSSWVGVGEPRPWKWWYCQEHKASGMSVYVPKNSDYFHVHTGSGVSLHFGKSGDGLSPEEPTQ